MAEVISKVLYPADNHREGKSLRLKQQYFFVSATIQSICPPSIWTHYGTLYNFHEKHVIQINDTHPALVIPELMRLLHGRAGHGAGTTPGISPPTPWHTPTTPFWPRHWSAGPRIWCSELLPRIWMILCEINDRCLAELREFFHGDENKLQEMAIIWGGEVRMANLCVAAGFAVNGVICPALRYPAQGCVPLRMACARPEKFQNVTNGVDHRRWLGRGQPGAGQPDLRPALADEYLIKPDEL